MTVARGVPHPNYAIGYAAEAKVAAFLQERGWTVTRLGRNGCMPDLKVVRGEVRRHIEVKAIVWAKNFTLSHKQLDQYKRLARQKKLDFWFAFVSGDEISFVSLADIKFYRHVDGGIGRYYVVDRRCLWTPR